jgi:hypothetical protein
MPTNLLHKLITEYPDVKFKPGRFFKWSADKKTLFYNLSLKNASALLLHELSHVVLGHNDFELDVELVNKESVAWKYAQKELAPLYNVTITDNEIEDAMDSYREWLHKRSLCPDCNTSAFQTKTGIYKCLACTCQWHANDARERHLRRYKLIDSSI